MAETVPGETPTQPQALQDDSQMLEVQEDAQPRTLEDTLGEQGANNVGRTTDYFVWFDLEVGAPLRAQALANHLSMLSNCKRQNMFKVRNSVIGVWSDGWAT